MNTERTDSFVPLCGHCYLISTSISRTVGWREASPLLAPGCDGAETSGTLLKFGQRFRSEYDNGTSVLRAWIEERQIVAGKMQAQDSFGLCSLNQIDFKIHLRAA
jgi:hypothetical protein